MPDLYAEIQVNSLAAPLDAFTLSMDQSRGHTGAPNSVVRFRPIKVTITGLAAILAFFTEWAVDSYLRRSGRIVVYEGDRVKWVLSFYDARCTFYYTRFRPGEMEQAAYQLTLEIAACAWEMDGLHLEIYSRIPWVKDLKTRWAALTPPAEILPPPSLRNLPVEVRPTSPQDLQPTTSLQAQPSKKRKQKPKSPYSGRRPIAPTLPVLSDGGTVNEYGKWYYERPFSYRSGVRDKAFEGAKEQDGGVYDPLTRTPIASTDKWDMGHKPGYEFRKHQLSAAQRTIGRKQFVDEHNVPGHYRPELPSSNRSHQEEDMTDLFLGGI